VAQTVNGCGTSICPARGLTRPPGVDTPNYDAVVCFVLFYLPLIPLRPIHAHSWQGSNYCELPIRWSSGLVFWAFARRWALALGIGGPVMLLFSWMDSSNHGGPSATFITVAIGSVIGTVAVLWGFARADRRHREIRSLIGSHGLGSSDPVDWAEEVLTATPPSMELFGTPSDAMAVPGLLEKGEYGRAMFAARMTAAREDWAGGVALTEKVLREPGAQAALQAIPKVSVWHTML
jgi:hypothetical protein